MQTKLGVGWETAESMAEDWRSLHRDPATQGANLFNNYDFLDVWQSYFAQDRALLILSVRDPDGALCGLAPFQIVQHHVRGVVTRRMGLMNNDHISRNAVLMRGDPAPIAQAMAEAMLSEAWRYDDFVIERMPCDCPAQIAFRNSFFEARFLSRTTLVERPLFQARFEGDEETYIETRKRRVRQDIRRAQRRCAELPGFTLITHDDKTRGRQHLRELFSLDWLSSKHRREGAIYTTHEKWFHDTLVERADDFGGVEFVEARSEGRLLASMISLYSRDVKYLLVTYSDISFNHASPGRLVFVRSVANGLADPRVKTVDFNGGSMMSQQLSTDELDLCEFKANHRRPLSLLIGLARCAKSTVSNSADAGRVDS